MEEKPPTLLERVRSAHLGRVLLVYAGASWAVIQVLDILDHFGLPDWLFFAGFALLLIGLPVVVTTALMQGEDQTHAGPEDSPSLGVVRADLALLFRHWATWPRALLGGGTAFSVLVAAALIHAAIRPPAPELDRSMIAVMPFHTVGEEVRLWGEGMVDLLSAALDGTGVVSTADPRAVLIAWRKRVGEVGDLGTREDAGAVAAGLGSGRIITGSVLVTGPGTVRLMGDMFDVDRMSKEASASVEGAESDMMALVDRLTIGLLKAVMGEEEVPPVSVSAITTTSVPALRAYLAGIQAFRQSRFDAARRAFERAVEEDSTFAMAAYGLSRASGWTDMEEASRRATLLATRHTGGLPERDSLLIVGRKLMEIDADPASVGLYERLTSLYPEDFEAWNGLAEAIFHHGHEVGYHLDRAVDALEHAYAIDSTVAPAYFHGIQSAFILDDTLRARRWSEAYLVLDSTSFFARSLRLAVALRLGPDRERRKAEAEVDTLSGELLERILWFAPPGRSSLEYAQLVMGAGTAPRFPESQRAAFLRRLAAEHLRHGQIAAWLNLEEEVSALDGRGHDLFLLTTLRAAGLLKDSTAIRLHERLAESAAYPREAAFLAAYWAEQGDEKRALQGITWLEQSADSLAATGDSTEARSRRGAALAYRGDLAAAQGDTAIAIDLIESGVAMMIPDWGGPRSLQRFLLADLLDAVGRDTEALRIDGALRRPGALEAPAYLRAARIAEARGEREEAIRYYTWFLDLWSSADPGLVPLVRSAQEAIGRLTDRLQTL